MSRGLFLSLDGIDGTGKSTQCQLLTDWLRAQRFHVTPCTDPGGTAVGAVIRSLLLDHRQDMTLPCEAFLFMASRAQLVAEVIWPALAGGQVVVSDRFLLANVVYQGHAGGIDPEQLWQMGRLSTGGLEPDLTLVLDLPIELALVRRQTRVPGPQGAADRMESRAVEFHYRVREGFLEEAQRRPERIRVIDASPPIEVVHERICQEVARVLATSPRT